MLFSIVALASTIMCLSEAIEECCRRSRLGANKSLGCHKRAAQDVKHVTCHSSLGVLQVHGSDLNMIKNMQHFAFLEENGMILGISFLAVTVTAS